MIANLEVCLEWELQLESIDVNNIYTSYTPLPHRVPVAQQ